MRDKKFTPGPWAAIDRESFGLGIAANNTNNPKWDLAVAYGEDNANLIAAAPELLEALEVANEYMSLLEERLLDNRITITNIRIKTPNNQDATDLIEGAIAKAYGDK